MALAGPGVTLADYFFLAQARGDAATGGNESKSLNVTQTVASSEGPGEEAEEPAHLSVTEPVPCKNVLTLQACTLSDYKDRLMVRAGLVAGALGGRERGENAGGGRV